MSTANLKDINIGTVRAKVIECKEFDTEDLEVDNLVALQTFKVGNTTDLSNKIAHVQSRNDSILFLEGDTDSTSGNDNPIVWFNQDGNSTAARAYMPGTGTGANGFAIQTLSSVGATQHIDFFTSGTMTDNGTGNLPTVLTQGDHMMRMRGEAGVLTTKINKLALGDPTAGIPVGSSADEIISSGASHPGSNSKLLTEAAIMSYIGIIATGSGTHNFPAATYIWTAQVPLNYEWRREGNFVTFRFSDAISAANAGTTAPSFPIPAAIQTGSGGGNFGVLEVTDGAGPITTNGRLVVGTNTIVFYSQYASDLWIGNGAAALVGFESSTIVYYLST
jgi:hypothetical protein